MTDINIVYYTYINPDNDYTTIIKGQLNDIIKSKIEATLFIVISCEQTHLIENIKKMIHKTMLISHIKYNLDIESKNLFEYYGIKKIYELAKNEPNKYYVYFHGKGMVNKHDDKTIAGKVPLDNYTIKHERTEINIMLTQHTLNPWKTVIRKFKKDDDIDIIALFPSKRKEGWFNFWWTKGTYLNKCEKPKITKDRYYYEHWLKSGKPKKIYNLLKHNYTRYSAKEAINTYLNYQRTRKVK